MRIFNQDWTRDALLYAARGGQACQAFPAPFPDMRTRYPGLPPLKPSEPFIRLFDWNADRLDRTAKALAVTRPLIVERGTPRQHCAIVRTGYQRACRFAASPFDQSFGEDDCRRIVNLWLRVTRRRPAKIATAKGDGWGWRHHGKGADVIPWQLFKRVTEFCHFRIGKDWLAYHHGSSPYSDREWVAFSRPSVAENFLAMVLHHIGDLDFLNLIIHPLNIPDDAGYSDPTQREYCRLIERRFPAADPAAIDLAVRCVYHGEFERECPAADDAGHDGEFLIDERMVVPDEN